jgi:two-component system LytT family response regulator
MSIRCLAIDDEPLALDKLKKYIERIPYLELVVSCACASDAMQVMAENTVDAIFLDINMPDINGVDFVKGLADPPMIVFITAYSEHAVESYKLRAVDYLLKPYSFVDFQKAAELIQSRFLARQNGNVSRQDDDFIFLKVDYRYVRVKFSDIVYIEGMNEYLKVHTVSGEHLLVHTTFKQLNGYLPEYFLQVHRSYVINVNYISEVERSVVLLENGKHISISDGNKDNFMSYLKNRSVTK